MAIRTQAQLAPFIQALKETSDDIRAGLKCAKGESKSDPTRPGMCVLEHATVKCGLDRDAWTRDVAIKFNTLWKCEELYEPNDNNPKYRLDDGTNLRDDNELFADYVLNVAYSLEAFMDVLP